MSRFRGLFPLCLSALALCCAAAAEPLNLGITLSVRPLPEPGPASYALPAQPEVVRALQSGAIEELLVRPLLRDLSVVVLDLAPPGEGEELRFPLLDDPQGEGAQRLRRAVTAVEKNSAARIIVDGFDLPRALDTAIVGDAIRGAAAVLPSERLLGFAGRLPKLRKITAQNAEEAAQGLEQLGERLRARLEEISAACQAAGNVRFFLRTDDPFLLAGLVGKLPERVVPLVEVTLPRPPCANFALDLAALPGAPRELQPAAPHADELLRAAAIAAAHRPAWLSLGDARLVLNPAVDTARLAEGLSELRAFLADAGGFSGQRGPAIFVDARAVAADALVRRINPSRERDRANFLALALNDAGCCWSVATELGDLDELEAKTLVLAGGRRLAPQLVGQLERWVEAGGQLVAYSDVGSEDLFGEPLRSSQREACDALLPAERTRQFTAEVRTVRFLRDIGPSGRHSGAHVSCIAAARGIWRASARDYSETIARWLELDAPAIVAGGQGKGRVVWINGAPHIFRENIVKDVMAYLGEPLRAKPQPERRARRGATVIASPEVWPPPAWEQRGAIYDIHLGGERVLGIALGPRPEASKEQLALWLSRDLRVRPRGGQVVLYTADGTKCFVSSGAEVLLGAQRPLLCPGRGTWLYAPRGGDCVARGPWRFVAAEEQRTIVLTDADAEVREAFLLEDNATCLLRLAGSGKIKMRIPEELVKGRQVSLAERARETAGAEQWVELRDWTLRRDSLEAYLAHGRLYRVALSPAPEEQPTVELAPAAFVGGRHGTIDGKEVLWLERYCGESATARFVRWTMPQRELTIELHGVVGDLYGRRDVLPGPFEVTLRVLVNGREVYRQVPPLKVCENDGDDREWSTLRLSLSPDVLVRGENELTLAAEGPNWVAFDRVVLSFAPEG